MVMEVIINHKIYNYTTAIERENENGSLDKGNTDRKYGNDI